MYLLRYKKQAYIILLSFLNSLNTLIKHTIVFFRTTVAGKIRERIGACHHHNSSEELCQLILGEGNCVTRFLLHKMYKLACKWSESCKHLMVNKTLCSFAYWNARCRQNSRKRRPVNVPFLAENLVPMITNN